MPLPPLVLFPGKNAPPTGPRLNPDGTSVHGCKFIYAPAGQAGEYAPLAANLYKGCGHKCAYCYVPRITKQDRAEFNQGAIPRVSVLDYLKADAQKYQQLGVTEQVMLSFTTDPYPPAHHQHTREALKIFRDHGLAFCTLTKGGTRALRDIDLFRPDRDAFASTITSLDTAFSRKWESGAADPADRVKALKEFHAAGIFTWVSLEPTLNIEASMNIMRKTHEFVDLFKIGRVNYVGLTETLDWSSYTHQMMELCAKLGVAHYFKKDLQPFLPKGYHNPLRVPQHH